MNRVARIRLFFTALPLFGALVVGCSNPAPVPSPVDEVVAANLAARGGEARIKALQSIRESGTVTGNKGRTAKVVREIKKPGLFRLQFAFQGTTSVFANDGQTGWQVAPLQGQFEPQVVPPEADSAGGADQRDLEGPLVGWREKGHTVELVGRATLPGGEADKLKVTLAGGAVRHDYVDVASHQVVRSEVPRIIRGHQMLMIMDFSDFREVGGLVFPHRMETSFKDRPEVLTIVIDTIELDPALDDALFKFPA